MITNPIYNKIQSVVQYTGSAPSPTRADLDTARTVHGGAAYLLNMGDVNPASSPPVSAEKTIGIYVPSHTKIKSAEAICVSGRMGNTHGDVTLNAGTEATYTDNAAAGTASSVATSEIKKASFFDTLAIADYDTTDEDYQFLKLQLEADADATTWDITKSINPIGYYLLDVAVCFEEHYAETGPGGPADDYYMNKTNTEVFVVWEDSLQLIGCLANAFEQQFGIEYAEINKGATEVTKSMSISTRDNMITGLTSYGFGTWLIGELIKGNVKTSGNWEVIDVDNGWKQIEGMEFFLWTHNQGGQDFYTRIYDGVLMIDGNMPWGTAEAGLGFQIKSLGNIQMRKSKDYWDHVKVAVYGNVS